jgi:hypothetical protein
LLELGVFWPQPCGRVSVVVRGLAVAIADGKLKAHDESLNYDQAPPITDDARVLKEHLYLSLPGCLDLTLYQHF